jgi:hypothetical protein
MLRSRGSPWAARPLVHQALAQCALGRSDFVDVELLEGRAENGDAARKDGDPVALEALQRELLDALLPHQLVLEVFEGRRRDRAVGPAVRPQHFGHRQDRARGAHGPLPAQAAVAPGDRGELQPRGHVRPPEAALGEAPVREEALGVADATHVEAVEKAGLEAFSDHALGAATADVEHQQAAFHVGRGARHTRVDEPGLLAPGDDLHGVAQGL